MTQTHRCCVCLLLLSVADRFWDWASKPLPCHRTANVWHINDVFDDSEVQLQDETCRLIQALESEYGPSFNRWHPSTNTTARCSWKEFAAQLTANYCPGRTKYGTMMPPDVVLKLILIPPKGEPVSAPPAPACPVDDELLTSFPELCLYTSTGWRYLPGAALKKASEQRKWKGVAPQTLATVRYGWSGFPKWDVAPAWFYPHVSESEVTPDFAKEISSMRQQSALSLIDKDYIRRHGPPWVLLPLFHCYSGSSPTGRPVWDARYPNLFEKDNVPGFSLPKPRWMFQDTPPNCEGAVADLKSGWYHISMHPSLRPLYCIWDPVHQCICETSVLPFGLSSAPRAFYECTSPAYNRAKKDHPDSFIYLYIDDLTVIRIHKDDWISILQIFMAKGFMWSVKKSMNSPAKVITSLGYTIDMTAMTASVADKRIQKVDAKLIALVQRPTVRNLAAVVGSLGSTRDACPWIWTFMPMSLGIIADRAKDNDWFSTVQFPLDEIQKAIQYVKICMMPLGTRRNQALITTDASTTGWGGIISTHDHPPVRCAAHWDIHDTSHINCKELRAIYLTVLSGDLFDCDLHILSDSLVCVYIIRKACQCLMNYVPS